MVLVICKIFGLSDYESNDEHHESNSLEGDILEKDVSNHGLGCEADFNSRGLLEHHDEGQNEEDQFVLHGYFYLINVIVREMKQRHKIKIFPLFFTGF